MSTPFKVMPGYISFQDIDGSPLESGFIYVGESGLNPESNPVSVYWDEALTIPAAQPIRTIGGFPSNNGTAGNLYTASNPYSLIVKNKNGSLVRSNLSVSDFSALLNGPNLVLQTRTVADMTASEITLVNGQPLSEANAVSLGFVDSGVLIKTSINNTRSNKGGAEYQFKSLAQHLIDIDDPTWTPDGYGDHYLFGGNAYVAILKVTGVVDLYQLGAAGDGSDATSDKLEEYQAIQAAYDYAEKNNIGEVYHPTPNDRYKISQGLQFRDNIRYFGAGNEKVIIEQSDSDEPVGASSTWWSNSTGGNRNIRLDGLRAVGNPANPNNHGFLLRAFFSSIENCMASSCGGDGLGFTEDSQNLTTVSETLVENKLLHLKTFDCVGRGVINGNTSAASNILTDGFADDIIVRQPASPTTRAVEFNCTAGWSIGYIHAYVQGGDAPTDAIWFRNPFYTELKGPFYVERFDRYAVSVINWDRASSIGVIVANSSDCTDGSASALRVTRIGSQSSAVIPVTSAIARGSNPCHAISTDSGLNKIICNAAVANMPIDPNGNPISGGEQAQATGVKIWRGKLEEDESESLLVYDNEPLVKTSTFKGIGVSVNQDVFIGAIPNSNGCNGTIKVYGRISWGLGGGAISVQYQANFHVSIDSGGVARVILDEISNTGVTGMTLTPDNANGNLNLAFTQPDAATRSIVTVESLNGFMA